jgi:hypothetical protein
MKIKKGTVFIDDVKGTRLEAVESDKEKITVLEQNSGKKYHIKEIEHFHPDGKKAPNGVHYERGGYFKECIENSKKFSVKEGTTYILTSNGDYILAEALHSQQYGLSEYKGGITVFSTDVNAAQLSNNRFVNHIKQVYKTFQQRYLKNKKVNQTVNRFNASEEEYIGAFSVGSFFQGKYVSDNGKIFSEKSASIEINGLSTKALNVFAEMIANEFLQETVLVKDLNSQKIYLVNGEKTDGDYDLTQMVEIWTIVCIMSPILLCL